MMNGYINLRSLYSCFQYIDSKYTMKRLLLVKTRCLHPVQDVVEIWIKIKEYICYPSFDEAERLFCEGITCGVSKLFEKIIKDVNNCQRYLSIADDEENYKKITRENLIQFRTLYKS